MNEDDPLDMDDDEVECDGCGEIVLREDAVFDMDEAHYYCVDCTEPEEPDETSP